MANYSQLKAAIADVIKTNGTQAITGQVLQDVLNSMVSVIGANYTFAGVATPSTNPGTPDQNVFYITATGGTYANFGGVEVPNGLSILQWNGTWTVKRVLVEQPENLNENKSFIVYNHMVDQPSAGNFSYREISTYDALWIYLEDDVRSIEVTGAVLGSCNFLNGYFDDSSLPVNVTSLVMSYRKRLYVPDGAKLCIINLQHSQNTGGYGDLTIKQIKKDNVNQYSDALTPTILSNTRYYNGSIVSSTSVDLWKYAVTAGKNYALSVNYSSGFTGYVAYAWYNGDTLVEEGFCETGMLGSSALSIVNMKITAPAGADTLVVNKQQNRSEYYYYLREIIQTSSSSLGKKKNISLLMIGNSLSQDALAYVPFIIKNMGIDVNVRIGILMMSDSTLQDHLSNFENESTVYTFYYMSTTTYTHWRSYNNYSIQMAFNNFSKWDIVSLQQGTSWRSWSTYQPTLNQLINDISAFVSYPIRFVWHHVYSRPAQSNGGANYTDAVITEHYESMAANSERVLNETVCEAVVPVGTAIQNARTIQSIRAIGDYATNPNNALGLGYLAANDGVHLQEGLPSQIAAYTWVVALLKMYGFVDYILGETTRVTSDWIQGKSIPGPHGSPTGSTDENCLIAQKAVLMAFKKPFEVTDMNYIINPM